MSRTIPVVSSALYALSGVAILVDFWLGLIGFAVAWLTWIRETSRNSGAA